MAADGAVFALKHKNYVKSLTTLNEHCTVQDQMGGRLGRKLNDDRKRTESECLYSFLWTAKT